MNNVKALLATGALALLLISGCSMTGAKKTDQREWIEVSCNGFADWTTCNAKAAKFCPDGFDVTSREENLVTQHRGMTLACKK